MKHRRNLGGSGWVTSQHKPKYITKEPTLLLAWPNLAKPKLMFWIGLSLVGELGYANLIMIM